MTNEEIQLAVKKGVLWLDENHDGWEFKIDLSKLQMSNCERCVIGQAVGNYWRTTAEEARKMRESEVEDFENYLSGDEWAAEHGFDVNTVENGTQYSVSYAALEAAWVEVLNDRLGRL